MTAVIAAQDEKSATGDDAVVLEAFERWKACNDWQGVQDERIREDIKFANGDARNSWQWPTKIFEERNAAGNELPCLTINNTRVHNDLIINQISKNNYGVKIRPTGGKATYQSAQVMQSIIRRIEDISKFSAARRKITEQQVDGGIGYCLIETAYVSNRSRNQDIYLKASRDPTAVYLDPWIREADGSDANFGFVFERLPRKEFDRKYPKWKNKVGTAPIDATFANWISDKEIMLAKYFRKKQKPDTYVWYKNATGEEIEKLASEIKEESGDDIYKALMKDIKDGVIDGGTRSVFDDQVEWFLIAGDTVIDKGDWAGKYIPICRCVGRELIIDATLDIKGHTRPLIDAQRMLNFSASTDVQMNALQPKSPFVGSAEATEGQEGWKSANINAFAVLLYNQFDDEGNKLDPPVRQPAAQPNAAYQTAMQNAERQMMLISGQWQQDQGQPQNQYAESGKAINARQQQGDTATYHFPEHQSDMLRFVGVQLLDLIPKIYDTERTLHIIDEKNEKRWIRIDPNQDSALQELQAEEKDEEAVRFAFNPCVGEYECVSDPGPDYATQRQEAADSIGQLMAANKELAGVAADLYFKYLDFKGADEIMERLQTELKAQKPYLFNKDVSPQLQQAQQQMQRLVALNSELMTKLADLNLKLRGRDEKRDIEAHRADTERDKMILEFLKNTMLTETQKADLDHQIMLAGHQHIYDTIQQVNEAALNPSVTNGSGNGSQ
jgi:hypothetical protein